MPDIKLLKLDGKFFENEFFNNNKPKIFILFSTDCDLCKDEINLIFENMQSFKNVQICFISTDPIDSIKKFTSFDNEQTVLLLQDVNLDFTQKMDVKRFPSIYIFDSKNILKKKIEGTAPIQEILENITYE